MKKISAIIFLFLILISCGKKEILKLGDAPLTITVQAVDKNFDGYASVYINGKYIGTTDNNRKSLKVELEKGEYTIIVTAPGYKPWRNRITLLGNKYKQNAFARLEKETVETEK